MPSSITGATQTHSVAQSTVSSRKSTPSKAQSIATAGKDTVQLSSLAQAAIQEASETSTQTAKEASGGDAQAQRLLAKEAAKK
ncbi:MAG TPA: hypothetical protein VN610_11340 [Bryobacteraceae bacterium]|nr:hypothetical protein [Bryobacteraceae bacterium]